MMTRSVTLVIDGVDIEYDSLSILAEELVTAFEEYKEESDE